MSSLIEFAAILTVLGGLCLYKGFKLHRQAKLIRDTPTSNIRSMSVGPVEVTGTAQADAQNTIEAPVSGKESVYTYYKVEERRKTNDRRKWVTIAEGCEGGSFYIDDGTGRVWVDPTDELEVDASEENTAETRTKTADRDSLERFIERCPGLSAQEGGWLLSSSKTRRFKEEIIRPGDETYLFGTATRRQDDPEQDYESELKVSEGPRGMFFVSDQSIEELLDERMTWYKVYILGGALGVALGVGTILNLLVV